MELTFFDLGIKLVVTQDLENSPDVADVAGGVLGVDDDVIQDADCRHVQVISKNVIHKKLKRGRGVSAALRADQVFKVSFSTPECCLPFMTFLNPYLMISIPQIYFCEYFCRIEAIQHFRDEGKGIPVFHRHRVELPIVDHEAQLPVVPFDKHAWDSGFGAGVSDEAICQVSLDILLHGSVLQGRHGVDATPRWGCARFQINFQVVLAVRGEHVGLRLGEHVEEVMVVYGNLVEQAGVGGSRSREGG